jgi:hypothetical protein
MQHAKVETFIAGSDHHGQPEFEPVLSATPAI